MFSCGYALLEKDADFLMRGALYHPGFGEVLQYDVREVSTDPDTQVSQVIGMMRDYTRQDASSPEIARDAQAASETGEPVEDVFNFIRGRSRIAFTQDEDTARPLTGWLDKYKPGSHVVEVLIRPVDMSILCSRNRGKGDCDDFSMYAAALLRAKGVPARFCTIAADPEQPNVYSHVYVVAYPRGRRVPLDVSHGPYAGWESPVRYRIEEWDLASAAPERLLWAGLLAGGAYLLYRGIN